MTRTISSSRLRQHGAFTLMELLTVIAIIAVLAALAVPLAGAAKSAKVNSRTTAELRELQTAIESYKGDRNAFPPDHLIAGPPKRVDPVVNPLFYELRGMQLVDGVFRLQGEAGRFTSAELQLAFGRKGILNSSADAAEPVKSYLNPKASSVRRIGYNGVNIEVLATSFDWPANADSPAPVTGSLVNPWRYVSTSPTNNTGNYDLWAEVYVGKEKKLFKNW